LAPPLPDAPAPAPPAPPPSSIVPPLPLPPTDVAASPPRSASYTVQLAVTAMHHAAKSERRLTLPLHRTCAFTTHHHSACQRWRR
jgi:hypothetical protein